jgi:tetratricopeptide (TPR) repeat protein
MTYPWKRIGRVVVWGALLAAPLPRVAFAQEQQAPPAKQKDDPATAALRSKAVDLYRAGKFVDAMPLLEQLSSVNPKDYVVKEHWAYCVLEYSKTLSDPGARKTARVHARTLALEAQKAGDQSDMLQELVSIPEDGSEMTFSDRADVDAAMKAAEAERGKGNLDKAREGYLQVLELEPKNYDATVYVGDIYFSEHAYNSAGEWFAKAVQVDPNREMAYRFWGDALAMEGKNDGAREKYINAVIAQPYTRAGWAALRQWADRVKQPFNAILLENKSSAQPENGKSTGTIDEHALEPANPEKAGWAAYTKTELVWRQGKFQKEYPNETAYRRSLKEEVEALDTMVNVLASEAASEKKAAKLDPNLLELIQIDHEGLLDAYVLFNRADREIARDYPAYRAEHRDKLYRYMDEFVLPKGTTQAAK